MKTNIREYGECSPVEVVEDVVSEWAARQLPGTAAGEKRLVIYATNQCGHDGTAVDLLDVIDWVKAHRPDLLEARRSQ